MASWVDTASAGGGMGSIDRTSVTVRSSFVAPVATEQTTT